METAVTNGILIQQRIGNTPFFNRSWEEFKVGFGNESGNYWMGNERLHQLTKDGQYKLRVDVLSKFKGQWYWAEYDRFSVGIELAGYKIYVGDYRGDAGDAMTVDGVASHNMDGVKFQTYDHGNHVTCASVSSGYAGGFWYPVDRYCGYARLNRNRYFHWYSLPIGTRSHEHVALLKSRMTLLRK